MLSAVFICTGFTRPKYIYPEMPRRAIPIRYRGFLKCDYHFIATYFHYLHPILQCKHDDYTFILSTICGATWPVALSCTDAVQLIPFMYGHSMCSANYAWTHSVSPAWTHTRTFHRHKIKPVFHEKMYEKVIDTSALKAYYRGSSWVNKLYRDQKQKTRKKLHKNNRSSQAVVLFWTIRPTKRAF